MSESLIVKRKSNWKRLEELIKRVGTQRGIRNLDRREISEFIRLYRRTSSDLAIARVESRDQRLVSYLNSLVIRAHGLLYRTPKRGIGSIVNFYFNEFPSVFRQTYRYTLATFLIFSAIAVSSFIATWRSDDFADFAYVPRTTVWSIKAKQGWWEDLNREAPKDAAMLMANNIGVSFKVFSLSIFPLVGTMYVLMPSALQFGAINALIVKYRMTLKLWAFVAGHGILEFTAIFMAGGAGLLIGLAILVPGERSRRDALIERGALAIRLLLGSVPLLVIAGLLEGFISPLDIHPGYKAAISIASALGLAAYLLKPSSRGERQEHR